jgi:dihydroorotase
MEEGRDFFFWHNQKSFVCLLHGEKAKLCFHFFGNEENYVESFLQKIFLFSSIQSPEHQKGIKST